MTTNQKTFLRSDTQTRINGLLDNNQLYDLMDFRPCIMV
jgi:hypothetical protein